MELEKGDASKLSDATILNVTIQLGPKLQREGASISEIARQVEDEIQHNPNSLVSGLLKQVLANLHHEKRSPDDVPSGPIRVDSGWGECGSCNVQFGGRGQLYYDNIGGVHCYAC